MEQHSQPAASAAQSDSPLAAFLAAGPGAVREAPESLWGFGGLHGGLALAAMLDAAASTAQSPHPLRSVTGRFHRPVRGPFTVEVSAESATRSTSGFGARIVPAAAPAAPAAGSTAAPALASATALFGAAGGSATPVLSPPAPAVPGWREGELFRPPPTLVPVGALTEIRALGPHRPFAGGAEPELTAWLRVAGDDAPPTELHLLFLVDALAPSYAALLTAPTAIPTVELSVAFTGTAAVSPWVLLEARTTVATRGGWISETIQVWGEDGTHLAEAKQLRLVRQAQAS